MNSEINKETTKGTITRTTDVGRCSESAPDLGQVVLLETLAVN